MAIAMGGHVRVGLEDNLFFDNERKRLATNRELVERVAGLAGLMGRRIATPKKAREMLGIYNTKQ